MRPMPDQTEDKTTVSVLNKQTSVNIESDVIDKLARYILTAEASEEVGELSLTFVDKKEMSRLNEAYRKIQGPTDVLSFSLKRGNGEKFITPIPLLGNVIVCPEVAAENAAADGIEVDDEIELLVAHGILHILGYSHNNDAREKAMTTRQSKLVNEFHENDNGK